MTSLSSFSARPRIARGVLVSFNASAYTASVRLDGGATQALNNVPVAATLPAFELQAGRRVLLDLGLSGELGDAVVVAVISGAGHYAVAVLDRAAADLDVVNSAAETAVYSFSVPGGTLGADRALRLSLFGDFLNNSGANQTVRLRVKYGATTLYDDVSGNIAANANRSAWRADILLAARATNDQKLGGWFSISAPGGTTAGQGDLGAASVPTTTALGGSAGEDSTAAKTLQVTVQLSAANANLSFRRRYGLLEVV